MGEKEKRLGRRNGDVRSYWVCLLSEFSRLKDSMSSTRIHFVCLLCKRPTRGPLMLAMCWHTVWTHKAAQREGQILLVDNPRELPHWTWAATISQRNRLLRQHEFVDASCYCYCKLLNDKITLLMLICTCSAVLSAERGSVARCLHPAKTREEERLLL